MSEPIDTAAMRIRAAKATPGPWVADTEPPDDCVIWAKREIGDDRFLMNVGGQNPSEVGVVFDVDAANALHIAALDPATVRAWADETDRLRAEVEALRRVRDAAERNLRAQTMGSLVELREALAAARTVKP